MKSIWPQPAVTQSFHVIFTDTGNRSFRVSLTLPSILQSVDCSFGCTIVPFFSSNHAYYIILFEIRLVPWTNICKQYESFSHHCTLQTIQQKLPPPPLCHPQDSYFLILFLLSHWERMEISDYFKIFWLNWLGIFLTSWCIYFCFDFFLTCHSRGMELPLSSFWSRDFYVSTWIA